MKKIETVTTGVVCDTCDHETNEFQDFFEVTNQEDNISLDLCKTCFDKLIKSNLTERADDAFDLIDELFGGKKYVKRS